MLLPDVHNLQSIKDGKSILVCQTNICFVFAYISLLLLS